MGSAWRVVLALAAVSLAAVPVRAQPSHHPSGFLAGRFGINVQAVPDGLSGAAFGAGASIVAFAGADWALEFEAWLPGAIEDRGVWNKTLLVSGSAIRFFDDGGRGPFLVFGLTAARIEFGWSGRRDSDFAAGGLLGMGSAVRLSDRTMLVPELRLNVIDGGAFLIRPSAALLYMWR